MIEPISASQQVAAALLAAGRAVATLARTPEWKLLEQVAEYHTPRVAAALKKGWKSVLAAPEDAYVLEAAISAGNIEGAVRLVESALIASSRERTKLVTDALKATVIGGANAALRAAKARGSWYERRRPRGARPRTRPPARARGAAAGVLTFTFDHYSDEVARYALSESSKLITEVDEATKDAVRKVIAFGIEEGYTPTEISKLVREYIGLREDQYRALDKFIQSGAVQSAIDEYADDLLNQRATLIARTETQRSSNEGQRELWEQAVDEGQLPENAKRVWIATDDERTRDTHRWLGGIADGGPDYAQVVGLDEHFHHEDGTETEPGWEPNCRCAQGIATPEDMEAAGFEALGGPGSGNFGHAGRPGERGGSAPRDGGDTFEESGSVYVPDPDLWNAPESKAVVSRLQKIIGNRTKGSVRVYDAKNMVPAAEKVADALDALKKDGYKLPRTVVVETTIRDNLPAHGFVMYSPNRLTIEIADTIPDGANLDDAIKVGFATKPTEAQGTVWKEKYAFRSLGDIVNHEVGHLQDPEPNRAWRDTQQAGWGETKGRQTAFKVSKRAADEPSEFIAETFVRLRRNEKLPDDVMKLYSYLMHEKKGKSIRAAEAEAGIVTRCGIEWPDWSEEKWKEELKKEKERRDLGGPGSGNFGHAGRPGERGGSAPSGGGDSLSEEKIEYDEGGGMNARVKYFLRDVNVQQKQLSSNTVWEYIDTPKGPVGVSFQHLDYNKSIELHWLNAEARGSGRAAMEKIVAAADKHGVTITGFAVPLPGQGDQEGWTPTVSQLLRFYGSFGFKKGKKDSDGYYPIKRVPQRASKRSLGGPGSGNFGHAGRPGERGGSAKGEGGSEDSVREGGSDYGRAAEVAGKAAALEVEKSNTKGDIYRQAAFLVDNPELPYQIEDAGVHVSTNDTIDDIAAKVPGTTVPDANEARDRVEAKTRDLLDTAHVAVRVSSNDLDAIINDGQLKTQFETGTTGGDLDLEARARVEAELYGEGGRPIYGFAFEDIESPRYEGGRAQPGPDHPFASKNVNQYGDVSLVMKDEIRDRSTFTTGDTLFEYDAIFRAERGEAHKGEDVSERRFSPVPMTGEGEKRFGFDLFENRRILDDDVASIDDVRGQHGITETQIHGGVKLGDIDSVVVHANTSTFGKVNWDAIEKAHNAGLRVRLSIPKSESYFPQPYRDWLKNNAPWIETSGWAKGAPKSGPNPSGKIKAKFGEPRDAGGPGSGNFGHAGRPGEVGGSASGGSDSVEEAQHSYKEGGYDVKGAEKKIADIIGENPVAVSVGGTHHAVNAADKVATVLSEMKALGYKMPTGVHVGMASGGLHGSVNFSPKNQWAYLNIDIPESAPQDASLDDIAFAAFGAKDGAGYNQFAGPTFDDVIVHEMGHIQHLAGAKESTEGLSVVTDRLWRNPNVERGNIREISEYALRNSNEFVAEAFVRLYRGEKLSKGNMLIYEALNGPKVMPTL